MISYSAFGSSNTFFFFNEVKGFLVLICVIKCDKIVSKMIVNLTLLCSTITTGWIFSSVMLYSYSNIIKG